MLQKCEGIVIRSINYGETNKIVTMYTRERGKLAFMARGAKKPNSRLSSITQPFTHGYFLVQTGSGLGTMQQGEIVSSLRSIREDLMKTAYAAYMAELIDKCTEEKQPDPYLFEFLQQSFHYLDEDYDPEILANIFEMKMLRLLGLHPVLDSCINCGSTEGKFALSIRENGLLCHRCFEVDPYLLPLSQPAIKLLRIFYFFDLNRLGKIDVKPQTKKELRVAISMYFDEYSGLYFKSRKFLEQLDNIQGIFKKEREED